MTILIPNLQISKMALTKTQLISEIWKFIYKEYKDLVNKITSIKLNSVDRLVSFDVEVLFPNIPVDKLMKSLVKWLNSIEYWGFY